MTFPFCVAERENSFRFFLTPFFFLFFFFANQKKKGKKIEAGVGNVVMMEMTK